MRKQLLFSLVFAIAICATISTNSQAHCEMPCGIYNDSARFVMLNEDITTIEKAMIQITELSKADEPGYNQIVRWINTKEETAQHVVELCADYFLAQRIKVVAPADSSYQSYQLKLGLLHQMILAAVKCKQTTDTANTAKLAELMTQFQKEYFGLAH